MARSYSKPVALVILDGFGYRTEASYNAVAASYKPTFDYLWNNYPHALLNAAGVAVGLPAGMAGNSSVGHLTIGAGRIIEQNFTRIENALRTGSFFHNKILIHNLQKLAHTGKTLHLLGLLSNNSAHGNILHIIAVLTMAKKYKIHTVIIHPFLDGRDSPPESAATYLRQLQQACNTLKLGVIGSLQGRFFAMDRDNNWDRTKQSYDILTQPHKVQFVSWQKALDYYYDQKIFDEFIPPTQLAANTIIKNGDGVIVCNFRADRARQLTAAFTQKNFSHFAIVSLDVSFFITMTDYELLESTAHALFEKIPINNTLKECLADAGKTIFSIAETEKYAHITYFFDGGTEKNIITEKQILIPSHGDKNYAVYPQMSAKNITNTIIQSLKKAPADFYLINYANADMVGHSGNFFAAQRAIECLDQQLALLYEAFITERDGILLITADHGNAEEMFDPITNQPKTSHTANQVPFILVSRRYKHQQLPFFIQQLSDIAPLILHLMHIPPPAQMSKREYNKN